MAEQNNPQLQTNNRSGKRIPPRNELDLQLMTIDSVWGKSEVPEELRERLNKIYEGQDENGQISKEIKSLWSLLAIYTRDMRLANLSNLDGEVKYAREYLNLASDFLQAGMTEPFVVSFTRVATVLELSQSKGGFLRKRMNTFSQETFTTEMEPPKKGLFGFGKKKEA